MRMSARARLLAWLPFGLFLLATLVLYFIHSSFVWEPPLVLPTINTVVFLTTAAVVAMLAAVAFAQEGALILLAVGTGTLLFGLATAGGPFLLSYRGDNAGVTMHNILSLLAGIVFVATLRFSGARASSQKARLWLVLAAYAASFVAAVGVGALAATGALPPFVQASGEGTLLRSVVLYSAAGLFALASGLFARASTRTNEDVLELMAIGLGLASIGLVAVGLSSVGSEVSWAGRFAQDAGQIYLALGLIVALARQAPGRTIGSAFERLQRALDEAEARNADLVRYAPTGIYEVELDTLRFLSANEAMARLTGRGVSELLEMRILDLLDEPDAARIRERARLSAAGEQAEAEEEYVLLRSDGSRASVSMTWRTGRDEHGRPARLLGIAHDVTERRTIEQSLRESEHRYRTLLQAAVSTTKSMHLSEVLDALAEAVLAALPGNRVRIGLIEGDVIRTSASRGAEPLMEGAVFPLSGVPASISEVLDSRHATVTDYDALPPEQRGMAERFGSHLVLWVPMALEDRVLGIMAIDQPGARRDFTSAEIDLATAIASQATTAIQNAQLFHALDRSNQRFEILSEANSLLLSSADPDSVIHSIAERVMRYLNADLFVNYVVDQETGRLHLNECEGIDRRAAKAVEHLDLTESICGSVARGGKRIVSEDVQHNGDPRAELVRRMGIRCYVCNPLKASGRTVGTLSFGTKAKDRFDVDELDLMRTIATQLSIASEQARLYQTEHEMARFGGSMVDINEALVSSLDLDATLPRVLELTVAELGAVGATVFEREPGGWLVRSSKDRVTDIAPPGTLFSDEQTPELGRLLVDPQPRVIDRVRTRPAAEGDADDLSNMSTVAVYPLAVRGEVTGAFAVRMGPHHRFSPGELDYLRRIAFAISLSEENHRLFEAQRDVADRLQEALLALPSRVEGISFAHSYHSPAEVARVGGDFYDVFDLSYGLVGITIGDVAGKGLDAAVLTSMAKNTIRAHANERGKSPHRILELTNQVVYRSTATESFVTLFFGLLDRRDGRLVYASAGHTTGLLVCADGSIGRLAATGPLLGAFETVSYEHAETRLDERDVLFLYTDGLTEARGPEGLYGEERLIASLSGRGGREPAAVVRDTLADVMAYSGNRLMDDLAMLAVRLEPGEFASAQQQKLEL